MFERMADIIPPGTSGIAEIRHATVTAADAALDTVRAAIKGYEPVKPGTICQLFVKGILMMSDGPNEWDTNSLVVDKTRGDVLIAGLGIGMILLPILRKPEVRSVTVIEKYKDVDALVTPHIKKAAGEDGKKLSTEISNIFDWTPYKGSKYDIIYFDIWNSVSTDDLIHMTKLKRKYGRNLRKANPYSWMGCWYENRLRKAKKTGQRRNSFPLAKERLKQRAISERISP